MKAIQINKINEMKTIQEKWSMQGPYQIKTFKKEENNYKKRQNTENKLLIN